MKKQNQNNKLTFNKVDVTELNNSQLQIVKGGINTIQIASITGTLTNLSKNTMCHSDAAVN
jgi:hypothetical protein